jgi:glycopeptide antibiotics resistance protein
MRTGFDADSAASRWLRWGLVAWVMLVLSVTLLPRWWSNGAESAVGATSSSVDAWDIAGNVLLFAPAGVAVALRGSPFRRALLLSASFSIAIELAQLVLPSGREAQVTDVLANTAGGAVGFLFVHVVRRLLAVPA